MSVPHCAALHGSHLFSLILTRYCFAFKSSRLRYFSCSFSSSVPERTCGNSLYESFIGNAHNTAGKFSAVEHGNSGNIFNLKYSKQKRAGVSSLYRSSSKSGVKNDSFGKKIKGNGRNSSRNLGDVRLPSTSNTKDHGKSSLIVKIRKEMENVPKDKGSKKGKPDSPSGLLKVGLDMCSKNGDVTGAINLYDMSRREGVKISQHHYSVLLYLCSSAAAGVVQPGKSGSGSRTLNGLESYTELMNVEMGGLTEEENSSENILTGSVFPSDGQVQHTFSSDGTEENVVENWKKSTSPLGERNLTDLPRIRMKQNNQLVPTAEGVKENQVHKITVSEDVRKYALQRGFEIYECMNRDDVPMNEATLTAMAKMAMSVGDGDMAFEMVKKMKPLGINPRLRSYGPALTIFCNRGDVENAFAVEKHMLENGVHPEEPELEALLRLSVGAGKGDKVYHLLHKLRTSVRKVSIPTACLIISWFRSKEASRLGKRKLSSDVIDEATKNNGGGWHGLGWLGKGKWNVSTTTVDTEGICKCCGKHLAIIDLDPIETEKFAESVASLAMQREKKTSFLMFKKWLDDHGPFEVVVDGANVGLFGQGHFMPYKVQTLVDGIHQKLRSKKWPLVVLHNRRLTGGKVDKPMNRGLVETWRTHDAVYATPTGSNDDWYWLYAAIKCKCLIVTNDEMRDHTFQLLGNNFFLKWKERHQVRFNFSDAGLEFYMPPAYSTVIQESEEGHWHVPVMSQDSLESDRTTWLCVTRGSSEMAQLDPPICSN